jgi:hypothetical protein
MPSSPLEHVRRGIDADHCQVRATFRQQHRQPTWSRSDVQHSPVGRDETAKQTGYGRVGTSHQQTADEQVVRPHDEATHHVVPVVPATEVSMAWMSVPVVSALVVGC